MDLFAIKAKQMRAGLLYCFVKNYGSTKVDAKFFMCNSRFGVPVFYQTDTIFRLNTYF